MVLMLVEATVEVDLVAGADHGHGIETITITITKNALLTTSCRHRITSSRTSPRGLKTLSKVGISLIWALLFLVKEINGAYDNMDFSNWHEIEEQMLTDAW